MSGGPNPAWMNSTVFHKTEDGSGEPWAGNRHPPHNDTPTVDRDSADLFIISSDDYKVAERVIECGFLPAVSLLGLPANLLNMAVFGRQGLGDKMNLCLFTLAWVDFMYLLCMLLSTVYCLPAALLSSPSSSSSSSSSSFSLAVGWEEEQAVKWYVRKHVINFVYGFWYSSGALTAMIATERCLCVSLPLKSATMVRTRTMACLVFGAILVINLLCLTYAFKHSVGFGEAESAFGLGNATTTTTTVAVVGVGVRVGVMLRDTALFLRHKVPFHVITDNVLPGISFLTFFVVVVVTVVTVRKLKSAMVWRQQTSSSSSSNTTAFGKRQITLVKMLIAVSCVYIACNAPKLSLAVMRFLVEDFSTSGRYRNLFFATHRAGHILLMLNSSVNVFIYYKQSSRFRKELQNMCACCFKGGPKTWPTSSSSLSTIAD